MKSFFGRRRRVGSSVFAGYAMIEQLEERITPSAAPIVDSALSEFGVTDSEVETIVKQKGKVVVDVSADAAYKTDMSSLTGFVDVSASASVTGSVVGQVTMIKATSFVTVADATELTMSAYVNQAQASIMVSVLGVYDLTVEVSSGVTTFETESMSGGIVDIASSGSVHLVGRGSLVLNISAIGVSEGAHWSNRSTGTYHENHASLNFWFDAAQVKYSASGFADVIQGPLESDGKDGMSSQIEITAGSGKGSVWASLGSSNSGVINGDFSAYRETVSSYVSAGSSGLMKSVGTAESSTHFGQSSDHHSKPINWKPSLKLSQTTYVTSKVDLGIMKRGAPEISDQMFQKAYNVERALLT